MGNENFEEDMDRLKRSKRSIYAIKDLCINLGNGKSNICYENANLTRLLLDDLGGNCNTHYMHCCGCSSLNDATFLDYELQTINCLRHANRIKKIINSPMIMKLS